VEPTEGPQRPPTNAAPVDGRAPAPAGHPYCEALLFFGAAFSFCLLGYVAAVAPGAWFPSASAKAWAANRLVLARGTGGLEQGELVVTAVDATGIALITIETDLRSSEYRGIAWNAVGVADQANASLLWRNDYAPTKLNSLPLTVASGRLLQISPTKDPNWIGRIRGIALVIQGPLPKPVRIRGVVASPMGALELTRDRIREWVKFEGFTGTSINSVTGGANVQDLPLPVLLATAVALAGLAWFGLARVMMRTAALPAVLAMLFVAAWPGRGTSPRRMGPCSPSSKPCAASFRRRRHGYSWSPMRTTIAAAARTTSIRTMSISTRIRMSFPRVR
jgi:hypothetical protein